ncbi:MAG TPA: methylated-DNA--[protein]-cysteine S-methyltransferase [Acidimicrobiales bacterium]|nr:methylated-DNA--[protein]-cysteine S-methyltransferase [Acidimicrobiales bacterium]
MTTTELLPARQRTGPASWDELTLQFPDRVMTVVVAAGDDGAVVGLRFGAASDHSGWIGPARRDPGPVADAAAQLHRYAAGELDSFDLRLRLAGSDFQLAVWSELLRIPFGETTTYGALAASIGRPGRARPVGTAVGSNPIGIVVPCHRVLGAGGALTGFAGGLDNKATLLAREGVTAF